MKKFKVCTGIGDNIWLLQKLVNTKEKFEFFIPLTEPRRGKQIFDLLPSIGTATYTNTSNKNAIEQTVSKRNLFSKIPDNSIHYLSFNKHLEEGKRIEDVFPDLETSFNINFEYDEHQTEAKRHISRTKKNIGIYTSKHGNVTHWKGWDLKEWFEFCKALNKEKECNFIIIGAKYDGDLSYNLAKELLKEGLSYSLVLDKPLGVTCALFDWLDYFVSFPSGLPVLANMLDCPTLMFYPKHLEKMTNTWASHEDILEGHYTGLVFPEVSKALEITKNYLL